MVEEVGLEVGVKVAVEVKDRQMSKSQILEGIVRNLSLILRVLCLLRCSVMSNFLRPYGP